MSLLNLLYGCYNGSDNDNDGYNDSGGKKELRGVVDVSQEMTRTGDNSAIPSGEETVGGGGRRRKDEEVNAGAWAVEDKKAVKTISHSCNPLFIKKSFMLCKAGLTLS